MNIEVFWAYFWGFIVSSLVYATATLLKSIFVNLKYKGYLKDEFGYNIQLLTKVIDRLRDDRITVSSSQATVFATYSLYIYPIGILLHCTNQGIIFDFLKKTEERSVILEFGLSIGSMMRDIDSAITNYQNDRQLTQRTSNTIEYYIGKLSEIKSGLQKLLDKI